MVFYPTGAMGPSLGCKIFFKPMTSDPNVQLSQVGFQEGPDISLGVCGGSAAHGSPKHSFPGVCWLHPLPAQIPSFCVLSKVGQHYPPVDLWEHTGSFGNSPSWGEDALFRLLNS